MQFEDRVAIGAGLGPAGQVLLPVAVDVGDDVPVGAGQFLLEGDDC
jgi:hypothetical protein